MYRYVIWDLRSIILKRIKYLHIFFVWYCYTVCDCCIKMNRLSFCLDGGLSDNQFPWKFHPTVNPVVKDKRGTGDGDVPGKYVYALYLLSINIASNKYQ